MSRGVVVTGVGVVSPLGVGAETLYRRLAAGDRGLVDGVGRCRDFAPENFLSPKELRRGDRFSHLAVGAAAEALSQAGWLSSLPYDPYDITCLIGSAFGGISTMNTQHAMLDSHGPQGTSPLAVPMIMPNAAAAHLCLLFGLRGESHCVAGACAAGTQAIGAGVRTIRAGTAVAAVVGGAESAIIPVVCESMRAAGALSPSGRSVPFSADRDGLLIGEGAGVLVLEDIEAARTRGATILGEVIGYGASTDGHHLTAPEPSARPAARAVTGALADAGMAPGDIRYINAHGTGTVVNDRSEVAVFRRALGDAVERIPLSSSKGALGHLFGAAGAVEAIATLQALRYATAPPTAGLVEPDGELGALTHVRTAMALLPGAEGMVGMSTSFGFGGHNAAVILRATREPGTS